ncbi:MAG: hypothetical protein ABIT38_23815, partial [Gemmatimonadaceae bacterium]
MKALRSCDALGDLCHKLAITVACGPMLCAVAASLASSAPLHAQRPEAYDSLQPRWEIVLRSRAFVIPESVVQGLPLQPTLAIWWRPTRRLQLGLDAQTVDNSGPGVQGNYSASRTVPGGGSGNFLQEITYEARGELLDPRSANQLHTALSFSRAVRSYLAIERTTHDSISGNRRRGVLTLEAQYARRLPKGSVEAGGVVSWLARDDALYLRALPAESRHFGPLAGLHASGELRLTGPLDAWGRVFVP